MSIDQIVSERGQVRERVAGRAQEQFDDSARGELTE